MDPKKHKKALMASLMAGPLLLVVFTALLFAGARIAPVDVEKAKAISENPAARQMGVKSFLKIESRRNPFREEIRDVIIKVEGALLLVFLLLTGLAYKPKDWTLRIIMAVDLISLVAASHFLLTRITSPMRMLKGALTHKQLLFFSVPLNSIQIADIIVAVGLLWLLWAGAVLYFAIALLHSTPENPEQKHLSAQV